MNGSEAEMLNPYFACMNALGLWQKQIVPSRKQRKSCHISDWHTDFAGNRWEMNSQEREETYL